MSDFSFESDYDDEVDYDEDYSENSNDNWCDFYENNFSPGISISDGDSKSAQDSQDIFTDEYSWNLIKEISDSREHAAKQLRDETFENLRNQCNGVMVKVDGVIHHLNRIQLALSSDYFEKLLTGDFNEKESQLVEIHSIDGRVFSYIIELINGKNLESVINTDNYVNLLIAMDFFQMEIDLKTFCDIIIDNFLKIPLKKNTNIFVLHEFVALQDKKFEYLLRVVRGYLSIHLTELYDCHEYLSFSADQLVKIISRNKFRQHTEEKKQIGRICAKWICQDVENRFSQIVDLVNAARYRYGVNSKIHIENVKIPFSSSDQNAETVLAFVEKRFIRLLNLDAVMDSAVEESKEHESENETNQIINKLDKQKKLAELLENAHFYDVTITAGGNSFKLHRFVLASKSDYFLDIFAAEISKAGRSENPSFPINKDVEYSLEEINSATFGILVKFMYFGIIDYSSCSNSELVRLLKAAAILKITELIADMKYKFDFSSEEFYENFIELMNFTYANEIYKEFYTKLYNRIISSWPEIFRTSQFDSISMDVLENILTSENLIIDGEEILNVCSRWIAYDVKNRFSFLTRICFAVNRNYTMDIEAFPVDLPKDWKSCSQRFIINRLWEILRSNTLVPLKTVQERGESIGKPMFVAVENKTLDILDSNLEKIVSIRPPKCSPFILNASGNSYFNIPVDDKFQTSATIIDDNLFIIYVTEKKSFFQVYNLSSKTLIPLASDYRIRWEDKITLLNCNSQVYGCFEDGHILRYVVELNRWAMFWGLTLNALLENMKFLFASNGNTLFKVPRLKVDERQETPKAYDFEQHSWISLPDLPAEFSSLNDITSATTVNGNLAVLYPEKVCLFDNKSQLWRCTNARYSTISLHDDPVSGVDYQKSYCISAVDGQELHYEDLPSCKNK